MREVMDVADRRARPCRVSECVSQPHCIERELACHFGGSDATRMFGRALGRQIGQDLGAGRRCGGSFALLFPCYCRAGQRFGCCLMWSLPTLAKKMGVDADAMIRATERHEHERSRYSSTYPGFRGEIEFDLGEGGL